MSSPRSFTKSCCTFSCFYVFIIFLIKLVVNGEAANLPDFLSYRETSWSFDDDANKEVSIGFTFEYFGVQHSTVYIGSNGILSFEKGDSSRFIGTSNCTRNGSNPLIMVFWDDIIARSKGKIYYYKTTSRDKLDRLADEVRLAYPSHERSLIGLLAVTWENVGAYGAADEDKNKTNTFQAILTSDGLGSYVLLYYNKIQWPLPNWDRAPTAGFTDNKGNVAHLLSGCGHCVTTSVIRSSNVGKSGQWVVQVDAGIRPSSLSFDIKLTAPQLTKLVKSLAGGDWVITVNAHRNDNA